MMFRSLSQVVGRALARKSGSRVRGEVAVEVLESRCLLTESSWIGSGMPNSGMPGSGDSLMGGSGSGSSGSSMTPMPGQDSLPSSSGQTYLPPTTGQDSLPPTTGQDSLPPTSGQDSLPPTSGQDSLPPATGQDSLPTTYGQDSLPISNDVFDPMALFNELFGEVIQEAQVPEDPANDWVLDLDLYEAQTGHTGLREFIAWSDMLRQEYLTGISSNWWVTPPNAYPVGSTPPVVPISPPVVIDNSVTITVSMTGTPQEGMSYAEFVIHVHWTGLTDTPLSVRVQEFSQMTFAGTANQLNETWLTFDSSHVVQSVLVPIADDSDWLPQNSVGISVALADSTLTLNSHSVLQTMSPVLENDAYLDPVTGEPDDSLYWQTMEAAQLRSSPYATWYSLWLPIYAPTNTEPSTPSNPSDGQSSPPYVAPNVPPENNQSSPPIIASAPVMNSSSSQSSSPPATEPIVVVSNSSGAGSSVETTSAGNNSVSNSGSSGGAGAGGANSGGNSSGDAALMTGTYEAGMSGNGSGSSSSGSTSGSSSSDSSSSNGALNSAMGTPTGDSSQSSVSTNLLGNQSSTSQSSSSTASSSSGTSSSSSTSNNNANANSSDNQFVQNSNSPSALDLLLAGGDSMQGGSSTDPTLGSGAMLYMGANGNVLMA